MKLNCLPIIISKGLTYSLIRNFAPFLDIIEIEVNCIDNSYNSFIYLFISILNIFFHIFINTWVKLFIWKEKSSINSYRGIQIF
jgi:hypothetical protein